MGAGFRVHKDYASATYDKVMNLMSPPQATADVLAGELTPYDTVIEVGCGTGRITNILASMVKHVIACDSSLDMIARFRGLGVPGNVSIVVGDVADANMLGPDSADLAICALGGTQYVEQLSEQIDLLRNIYSWLRPRGRILIEMFDRVTYDSLLGEHRFPIEVGESRLWLDMSVSRRNGIYTCVTTLSEQTVDGQSSGFTEVFRPIDAEEARYAVRQAGFDEIIIDPHRINEGFLWVSGTKT